MKLKKIYRNVLIVAAWAIALLVVVSLSLSLNPSPSKVWAPGPWGEDWSTSEQV